MRKEKTAKVVIIGEARVGKTSILTRYTQGVFSENMIPTLGIQFNQSKTIFILGIDYRFKRVNIEEYAFKL